MSAGTVREVHPSLSKGSKNTRVEDKDGRRGTWVRVARRQVRDRKGSSGRGDESTQFLGKGGPIIKMINE